MIFKFPSQDSVRSERCSSLEFSAIFSSVFFFLCRPFSEVSAADIMEGGQRNFLSGALSIEKMTSKEANSLFRITVLVTLSLCLSDIPYLSRPNMFLLMDYTLDAIIATISSVHSLLSDN